VDAWYRVAYLGHDAGRGVELYEELTLALGKKGGGTQQEYEKEGRLFHKADRLVVSIDVAGPENVSTVRCRQQKVCTMEAGMMVVKGVCNAPAKTTPKLIHCAQLNLLHPPLLHNFIASFLQHFAIFLKGKA
jgi:hypothetical protein